MAPPRTRHRMKSWTQFLDSEHPTVRPLIIGAAVFGYMFLCTESPALQADAVTDLLRARRCVMAGDTCWISGGPTADVFQGAAWVQLLAGGRLLGLGILGMKQVGV